MQDIALYSNICFTTMFVAEALAYLYALGPRQFFSDTWFCLLGLIAAASAISVILEMTDMAPYFLAPLLRVVRVTRFVKIFTSVRLHSVCVEGGGTVEGAGWRL